ncbi:MAG: 3-deoxy-D-manno-octulosonic acid transferase, partial [Gemmataceae bacterium]
RRSQPMSQATPVLLLDTMGELGAVYDLADVVVLGGSLTPGGAGHNLLEPAARGKPVVVGPYMPSQAPLLAAFLHNHAVVQAGPRDLAQVIDRLLSDSTLRNQIGNNARELLGARRGAAVKTCAQLGPLLPTQRLQPVRQPSVVKRCLKAAAATRLGQWLLTAQGRRFTSWPDIRARLGKPQSLLCLGNGPSSEDPRIGNWKFDRLFRVNARWRGRGFLAAPDVVFTGDYRALYECSDCLFGFRTVGEETLMLLRQRFRPWRRMEYFTYERLGRELDEDRWGARPSNGVVMVAAAVALQPERLIIAGIDLFQHPAGCYPGNTDIPNRYHPAHDRAVEVAILRQLLASYDGELIVIGAPLSRALEHSDLPCRAGSLPASVVC